MIPSFSQAEELFSQNRFADSLEIIQKLLLEQPDQPTLLAFQALCWVRLKAYASAEGSLTKALRLDPNMDFAYFVRSNLELDRGNLKEAEKFIQSAIDLNPIQAEYYGIMALCLFHRHAPVELIRESARQGLQFDPSNNLCQNVLSMAEIRTGRIELATTIMDFNLEKHPSNTLSLATQGWNYLHQAQPQMALSFFEKALSKEPEQEWARLGYLQAQKCRFPGYRFWLVSMLKLSRLKPVKRFSLLGLAYLIPLFFGLTGKWTGLNSNIGMYILVSLIFMVWYVESALSFWLSFTQTGKSWMKSREVLRARVLCVALSLAMGLLILYTGLKAEIYGLAALGIFLFSIPLGLILQEDKQPRRKIGILILGALAICGVSFLLMYLKIIPAGVNNNFLNLLGQSYLGGILAYCLFLLLKK